MTVLDKTLAALREAMVLTARVDALSQAVEKLETRQGDLRDRMTRIETIIELARGAQPAPQLPPAGVR